MHSKMLILDFGAQYTQLIARRVREQNVYCEIHPFDVSDSFIREFAPAGIILSGGPNSVTEGDTPRAPEAVWSAGVPVLGIWSVLDRIDLQSPAHASFLNEGERQRVPERQVYRTRTVRFCSEVICV